jgi:ribosomal protein L37AE/L43A
VKPPIRWAPKLPVAMIVRLYTLDAERRHDHDLADDVGWRLLARCQDVLRVSDSEVVCPSCATTFAVAWIGEPGARVSACPGCGWSTTADEYHASIEHRDLNGAGAREAFAEYVERFPRLRTYVEKLLAIDRLVHAVHRTGNLAARNLFEGRAREVVAKLDALAGRSPG